MANDNTNYKMKKTIIILNKMKPNEYCLWTIQAKSIFEMHKYLEIVLGNESNLTSLNDDERFVGSIDERLKAHIIF